jgi:circadian clock protein KaiB
MYRLKLFVAHTPQSVRATSNLETFCDATALEAWDVEIIDVSSHPQYAEDEGVEAVPCLIREHPTPKIRIFGDLSDPQLLAEKLGLIILH